MGDPCHCTPTVITRYPIVARALSLATFRPNAYEKRYILYNVQASRDCNPVKCKICVKQGKRLIFLCYNFPLLSFNHQSIATHQSRTLTNDFVSLINYLIVLIKIVHQSITLLFFICHLVFRSFLYKIFLIYNCEVEFFV